MLFIFDLGNVLFKIDFDLSHKYWSEHSNFDFQYIKDNFSFDEDYKKYEKSIISFEEFYKIHCEKRNLDISFENFKIGWNSIFLEEFSDVVEAVKKLRDKYQVIALTNTNEEHFKKVKVLYPSLDKIFHKIFASHEINLRKPDAECFEYILKQMNTSSEESVFFDDTAENVDAAQNLGIKSILVESPESVIRFLENRSVF